MFDNIDRAIELTPAKTPVFALIGYNGNWYSGSNDIRLFPIKNGKLAAETPFTKKSAKAIFESLKNADGEETNLSFKSIIPNNVQFFKSDHLHKKIVWIVNASKKYLHFKKELGIESGFYPLPKLLFSLKNNMLSVYALKKGIINEETKLYHAPFLNVYDTGSICMGNADLSIDKFKYVEDVIQYSENSFFNSIFTHTIHENILKSNLISYFKKIKNSSKVFDTKLLLETTLTLSELI